MDILFLFAHDPGPGRPIGERLSTMTDGKIEQVVRKLKEYIAELRQIPNETNSGYQICNSVGGEILEWRIDDSQRKELRFKDEAEFNEFLTDDMAKEAQGEAVKSHGVKHEMVFTHADLNPWNILADETGQTTGIVDWECAGWYPEYWDYTKAHFTV